MLCENETRRFNDEIKRLCKTTTNKSYYEIDGKKYLVKTYNNMFKFNTTDLSSDGIESKAKQWLNILNQKFLELFKVNKEIVEYFVLRQLIDYKIFNDPLSLDNTIVSGYFRIAMIPKNDNTILNTLGLLKNEGKIIS